MEPDLGVEIELVRTRNGELISLEDGQHGGRSVDLPLARVGGTLDGMPPLHEAGFFPDMDFLAPADQPDYDAPLRDSLGKLDEVFRLGLAGLEARGCLMLLPHLLGVKCALGLVEYQHVFGRHQPWAGRILLHVILHAAHERLASAAGLLQFVLEHLHQGAIAG